VRTTQSAESRSLLPERFSARGEGPGMRVYDGQIIFLDSVCITIDPHPYPSPLAKSAPGEGNLRSNLS